MSVEEDGAAFIDEDYVNIVPGSAGAWYTLKGGVRNLWNRLEI
nr:hypothetical protein [uncultured Campylobacter sp.]